MTAFVLVHGAWHAAWAWEDVVPLLPGHVEAVDLPGHGADATPVAGCTLDAYAARAVEALERARDATGGPALLVGHSLGGVTLAAASEARPDLVRAAVYLCAYMPADGESAYGLARQDAASEVTSDTCVMRADEGLLELDPDRIRDALYDGAPTAAADRAVARLQPEPLAPMGTSVRLTPERHGRVPRVYVACTRDRIVTPAAQRAMVAAQPCRTIELDAGHSPALSHPRELAAVLASLA